ncbi:V1R90 protein, partial [Crocuta crocuta]
FSSEVGIGITANTILLFFYVHTFLLEHRPKPTDLTTDHLALSHMVMELTLGFMGTRYGWGTRNIQSDFKCEVTVFLNKVPRGLSICTTCLLSVPQAITFILSTSCFTKFKLQSPNPILCFFLLLWVLNIPI